MNKTRTCQWAILGGLRFFLASIVFWTHANAFFRLPSALYHIPQAGAFAAVLGFFVVSGYSIAASLERDTQGFYERRLSRVYPVYFSCMVLACLPFLVYGPLIPVAGNIEAPTTVWPVVANFFLLGGIAVPAMPTNTVVWSLVIEAIYYLFAPLFARMRSRFLLGLILASCVAYWLHDAAGVPQFNTNLYGTYGTIALLWSWLLGFLLHRCPASKPLLYGSLVAGSVLLGRFDQYGAAHFSVAVLIASILVVSTAREIRVSPRLSQTLTYLGELSYPLYLCHFPVLLLLYGSQRDYPWFVGAAAVGAATLILYHGVDLPYRRHAKKADRQQHEVAGEAGRRDTVEAAVSE